MKEATVAMLPTDVVDVGTRFREDLGNVQELAESIKKYGVINPLAVKHLGDDRYDLIAGGRRMAAIKLAEVEQIPVRIYDRELTEEEFRSIELEENIQRKDLTWIEQCRLQREIHNLRTQIHGERQHSMDQEGWSLTDTAQLFGRDRSSVSKDIQLADAIEQFDDVDWSKCKNKHEASKQLNKIQEGLIRRELARRAEADINCDAGDDGEKPDPMRKFKRQLSNSYVVMDALEGLDKLESGIAQLVEIDPPYAIDLHDLKMSFTHQPGSYYSSESYNEIQAPKYQDFLDALLERCYRVMAENSWLIMWFGPEPWFQTIYDSILRAGFQTTRLTAKWTKGGGGQCMQPSYHLANSVEEFFYAWKGRPVLAKPGRSNEFRYSPIHPSRKTHPTERPVEMMQDIIETFSFENSQVIVPCCGSGNTILASYLSKRKAIGYDISPEYKESFTLKVNDMF
jgi:ParB/RepB/Spo0J family partition protein